jgi:hypothetical protein
LTIEEVKELVEKDIGMLKKYGDICSIGFNFLNLMFAMFVSRSLNWVGAGAGSYLAGQVLKARSKKVTELAIPRIQVANFVRTRSSK